MESRYGLVLAGGGTRGAYQAGAWKALKELGIKFDGIVGTSIGAINAALFFQNSPDEIINLYQTITLGDIATLTEDNTIDAGDIFARNNITAFAKEFAKNKGLDNAKLGELLKKYVDADKLYASKMDFGLVATALNPKVDSLEVMKEDIPKEELYDYIRASSCYPIFKPIKINDNLYVDGGGHDNIPVNLLLRKGYKKLLVIDISDEGIVSKLDETDAYIKVVRPNESLGGIFDFTKEVINRNIQMGYLDTLKAFRKLEGNYYYFKPRQFQKLVKIFGLKYIHGLELAAKMYEMDMYKVYSCKEFLNELYDKYLEKCEEYNKQKENGKVGIYNKDKMIGLYSYIERISEDPKYDTAKTVEMFLKEIKEAAAALIELENFMKNNKYRRIII